jgi:hypothetical protein
MSVIGSKDDHSLMRIALQLRTDICSDQRNHFGILLGILLSVELALVSLRVGVDVLLSLVVDGLVKMFLNDVVVMDMMLKW